MIATLGAVPKAFAISSAFVSATLAKSGGTYQYF
jgi:hypothetical protein